MDPVVGSSIISSMGSIGSGVAGYLSTVHAAKKQMEQTKLNIEAQDKRLALQRQQALEDRAHDEMYNSPAMERLRLEMAGMSPAEYEGQTTPTSSNGLVPDYSSSIRDNGNALVTAAGLGARSPMIMMDSALKAAETFAQIRKDNAQAADFSKSARVKELNAALQEATFADDVLAAELKNDLLYQQNQNTIQEGLNLVASRKLTNVQTNKLSTELDILQQVQEFKVRLAKAEAERAETETKLSQKQLDEVLPLQLRKLKEDITLSAAAAANQRAQANRTNLLAPFERHQIELACAASRIYLDDSSLAHDENVVKHNKFMSHIAEYEDALVAKYKLSRQEASWYAANQVVDMVGTAARTAASVYTAGALGSGRVFGSVIAQGSGSAIKNTLSSMPPLRSEQMSFPPFYGQR